MEQRLSDTIDQLENAVKSMLFGLRKQVQHHREHHEREGTEVAPDDDVFQALWDAGEAQSCIRRIRVALALPDPARGVRPASE